MDSAVQACLCAGALKRTACPGSMADLVCAAERTPACTCGIVVLSVRAVEIVRRVNHPLECDMLAIKVYG
jgi:hypothetical protein